MAGKADFTEAEWKTLSRSVTGAGMLVSLAHKDFTDSFGESNAMAKEMASEHVHSQSQLVRDLGSTHSTGFGLTTSPQKVEAETMTALTESVALLTAKAPDELEAYRAFVLAVAAKVAEAKGGVVAEETAMIARITAALGVA
jgi:hypothetical protein